MLQTIRKIYGDIFSLSVSKRKVLYQLFDEDRTKIEQLGRPAGSALRVHQHLQKQPVASIPKLADQIKMTRPTAAAAIRHLAKLGIVRELTGKERHRLFVYDGYVRLLSEGAEPLR